MVSEKKSKPRPLELEKNERQWGPFLTAYVFRLHLAVWMIIGGVAMFSLTYFFLRDTWSIQFQIERNLFIVGSISLLALPVLDVLFYRDVSKRYWEAGWKNTPRAFRLPPWFEFYPVMTETSSVIRKSLGYLLALCYVLAPVGIGGAMASVVFL